MRCARGKTWNLARNIYKLKEKDKATFYSPTEKWIMPAASTVKPEEREFVVDSGASIHTVSRKDLNSAELETMRISKNPTTVVTANGEVQTREEATVYVKELNSFVTVMLLEETPPVLSLWNLISPKMAKGLIVLKRNFIARGVEMVGRHLKGSMARSQHKSLCHSERRCWRVWYPQNR